MHNSDLSLGVQPSPVPSRLADTTAKRNRKSQAVARALNGWTLAGLGLILGAIVLIIAGKAFGPNPVLQTISTDAAPSMSHLFGTDSYGRDLFARTAAGGLISIEVALCSALLATIVGLPLGMLAGFFPTSWLDEMLMRLVDVVLAVPLLVLGVCVIGFLGPGPLDVGPLTLSPVFKVAGLIGLAGVPIIARVARSAVLVEREEDYIDALRVVGVSRWTILFNDILRNVAPVVLVQATAWMATAIFAEAGLGFLGLGIQPPTPTLGNMLQQSQSALLLGEWWQAVFPGAMIFLVIAGFNLIGDGLSKVLLDRPR
jgi:peptide/nickel transport system permease protein